MIQTKQTKTIIKAMLLETQGSNMLDSGGYAGRNWERNQKRNFESEPAVTWEWSVNKYDNTPIWKPGSARTIG